MIYKMKNLKIKANAIHVKHIQLIELKICLQLLVLTKCVWEEMN